MKMNTYIFITAGELLHQLSPATWTELQYTRSCSNMYKSMRPCAMSTACIHLHMPPALVSVCSMYKWIEAIHTVSPTGPRPGKRKLVPIRIGVRRRQSRWSNVPHRPGPCGRARRESCHRQRRRSHHAHGRYMRAYPRWAYTASEQESQLLSALTEVFFWARRQA